jgi:F0F1-type ATP synthase membrane subunit b/b'
VAEILAQLGIDQTFYYEFAIFVVIFLVIPPLFFKPFQKLIEARHQKTVADRDRAEELVKQANAKLEEFKARMNEERARARAEHERVIAEVKTEEAKILGLARDEAKKITQETLETIQNQSAHLKRALEADVEGLALNISDMLTKR